MENNSRVSAISVTINNDAAACDSSDVSDTSPFARSLDSSPSVSNQCISRIGDVDWYRVYAVQGSPLKFDLIVPAGKDYDMELYGSPASGAGAPILIKVANSGPGVNESLSHTATATDNFLVRILGYKGAFNAAVPYTITYTPKADSVAPTGAITSPAMGTVVSGVISVLGTASDGAGGGVSRVDVSIDGEPAQAAQGTLAWTYPLNTTLYLNGTRTISVKVTDTSGNTFLIPNHTLPFNNPLSGCDSSDAPDAMTSARPLDSALTVVNQCISTQQDSDWFQVTVKAGTPLQFDMSPPAGKDYDIQLFGPDESNSTQHLLTASKAAVAGQSESIQFTAPASGVFALRVYSATANFDRLVPYRVTYVPPAALPDLVASLAVSPGPYTPGQGTVPMTLRVNREGPGTLRGTHVRAGIWWSSNEAWDSSDTQLWVSDNSDFPVAALNSNPYVEIQRSIPLPSEDKASTFYLIFRVDPPTAFFPDGYHAEQNKTNNVVSRSVALNLPSGCADDLSNNSMETAKELSDETGPTGTLCSSSEADFFKIPLLSKGSLEVWVMPIDLSADIDIDLLDSAGISIVSGQKWRAGPGFTEQISCPSPASALYKCGTPDAGTYYLKVYRAPALAGSAFGTVAGQKFRYRPGARRASRARIVSGPILQHFDGAPVKSGEILIWPGVRFEAGVEASPFYRARLKVSVNGPNGAVPIVGLVASHNSSGPSLPAKLDNYVVNVTTKLRDGAYSWTHCLVPSSSDQCITPEVAGNDFTIGTQLPWIAGASEFDEPLARFCVSRFSPDLVGDQRVFLCDAELEKPSALGMREPLILVHGICGASENLLHPEKSQCNLDFKSYEYVDYPSVWLPLLGTIPEKYKPYVFRYETGQGKAPLQYDTLDEVAVRLKELVDDIGIGSSRQITIVAHSLGGLVARAFMQNVKTCGSNGSEPCGNRVTGLVTLASPHRGAAFFAGLSVPLGQGHGEFFVQDSQRIGLGNSWLDTLNRGPIFKEKIIAFSAGDRDEIIPSNSAAFQGSVLDSRAGREDIPSSQARYFHCYCADSHHGALPRGRCWKSLRAIPPDCIPVSQSQEEKKFLASPEVFEELFCVLNPSSCLSLAKRGAAIASASGLQTQSVSPGVTASITWAWNDVGGESYYSVTDTDGNPVSPSLSANTTIWTETGLRPNQVYSRRVVAYDSSGVLARSLVEARSSPAAEAISAEAAVLGPTRIRVTWGTGGNPVDTAFRATASTSPSFEGLLHSADVSGESTALVRGLKPNTTYYVRVHALDREGLASESTQTSTVTTLAGAASISSSSVAEKIRIFAPDARTTLYLDSLPVADGSLYISTEPTRHPVEVSPGDITAANSRLASVFLNSADPTREFIIYSGTSVYEGSLVGSLTLPYVDDNEDGIVDGTTPPLKVEDLRPYTLVGQRWVPVSGALVRDTRNHTVTFSVEHLSVYTLNGPTASAIQGNLDTTRAYPIPWKPGSGGKFDTANAGVCGRGLIFDQLSSEGTIRIYNVVGDLVKELSYSAGNSGCIAWDGKNHSGSDVASGVYIAVIKGAGGKSVKRLAIER